MSDKELQEYIKRIIKKYDYYDRIKDRLEVLRVGEAKNSKLLDIGAGYLSILAAKKFNCKVTSIDISEERIKEVKKEAKEERLLKKIKFIKSNATTLPFADNRFDISVSYGALHHCGNKYPRVVREMFRVSKKRVVVTEMTPCGVHLFDNYLYPEEKHKKMALDLENLKKLLQYYSHKIETLNRKCFTTFVCKKE
jgi:ubiquinone/menaquinone biosynthesis C-methylase UbiE